jgi:RHS repeat-associated protein
LPDGRFVEYGYTNGLLTSVKDLAGVTSSYGYDASSRLTSETDPKSTIRMRLAYDATTGRVSDQWDALNHHTTFAWDPIEQVSTMTDPNGGRWIDDYDNGVLFARVDPKGRCTFYEYNGNVELTSVINPRGDQSTFAYNAAGDLTATRNQTGLVTTTYNTLHDPVHAEDGKGVTADYTYDTNGNVLTLTTTSYDTGTDGKKNILHETRANTFTYDTKGQVLTATDARGYTTTYGYNASGDLTDVTSPEGRHTRFGYDGVGRRTSTIDPRSYDNDGHSVADYTATTAYTARDQVSQVTDPLGHTTTYDYDPQLGVLNSVTDANQHTTSYTYYADGQVHTATGPGTAAPTTTYTYDNDGNVKDVTDPDGRTVTYHYDLANEVTSQVGLLGTSTYGYDNDGRMTSTKAPGDTAPTTFTLNARGDVLTVDYPGDAYVTYTYDIHGNRKTMASPGASYTYSYDDYDQLIQVKATYNGFTDDYGYVYDKNGNLTSSTGPAGPRSYGYDKDGLLTSVDKGADHLAVYTYTSASQPKTISYGDGSHQTLGYDRAGRAISSLDVTAGAQTIVDDAYGLDNVGNPTSITHHVGASTTTDTYQYNSQDQLTAVCYATSTCTGAIDTVSWQYDAAGNRTQETRPAGTTVYNYNPATGELASTTGPGGTTSFTYNPNGQLTNTSGPTGTTTYTYNPDSTVASQTTANVATSYTYDGDRRRLITSGGATNTTTRSDWDPQTYQLVADADGANTLLHTYNYGLGPIGFAPTAGTGNNSYFHTDYQGSVTALTGADGALDATTTYEPYGVVKTHQVLDATAPTSPLGWEGQYTDLDGQSYLRARRYNPTLGAFTIPDPASATTASATYTYANGNPMTNADPSGLGVLSAVASFVYSMTPLSTVPSAIGAAVHAWQVCHGAKGSCALAITDAVFKTVMAVASVTGTGAIMGRALSAVGRRIATRGLEELGGSAAAEEGSALEGAAATCGLSFSPDTRVLLANGKTKPIAMLSVGDKVVTTDTKTGRRRVQSVAAVLINHDIDLLDLVVADVVGDRSVVHTTAKHPIWDQTAHKWVRAIHLAPGHLLRTADGQSALVLALVTPKITAGQMWDLTVAVDHDFFVNTGAVSILVHNCPTYHPRVRERGLEDPSSHNFPYSYDQAILKTQPVLQEDGSLLYRLEGTMGKKEGVFEIGYNPETDTIFHRFFRPNR